MKKLFRFLLLLITVMVGAAFALVIAIKVIDDEQHRDWLVDAVQSATGRAFSIDHLELDIGATIRVHAKGVSLGNASWSEQAEMLSAAEVSAEVHLPAVLDGVADVSAAVAGLKLLLETGEDGQSNWQFKPAEPARVAEEERVIIAIRPLIREILLTDSSIDVSRPGEGRNHSIHLDRVSLTTPSADTLLSVSGTVDSWPLSLDGNLGPLVDVVDRIRAPLNLSGQLADIALGVDGQWGPLTPAPSLALNVRLAASSTAAVAAMAGVEIGEPGALDMALDVTATDGRFALDDIQLKVAGDLVSANANGAVADLNRLQGMAIDVDVTTGSLDDLLALFGVTLPNPLPPNATLRGHVFGDQGQIGARDIAATLNDEALSLKASGKVDDVVALTGMAIAVEGAAPSLPGLSRFAGIDLPALGTVSIAGNVVSGDQGLAVSDLSAKLESDEVALTIQGAIQNLLAMEGMDAAVDLKVNGFSDGLRAELANTLAQFDVVAPLERLPDSLSVQGQLQGDLKALSVNALQARAEDSGLVLTLQGAVLDAVGLTGVDIALSATGPTDGVLQRQVDYTLPSLGKLTASGTLQSAEAGLSLVKTDIQLSGGLADLSVKGGIADLLAMAGIDARARLHVDDLTDTERASLSTLLSEFEVSAPLDRLPKSLTVESGLKGGLKSLSLDDARVTISDEGVDLTLSGAAEDVVSQRGIGADVEIAVKSFGALSRFAGITLPELGKLDLKGSVTGNEALWGLERIEGKLQGEDVSATLTGSVTDLVNMLGIDATLIASVDDLGKLGAILDQELPSSPPIALSATLGEVDGGDTHLMAEITSGDAAVKLEGDLSALKSPDQVDVALEVVAANLMDLQPFVQTEMPDMGPLSLSGNFAAVQPEGRYELKGFDLSLDDQSASGDLLVNVALDETQRTRISGNLTMPFLDLTPLLMPAADQEVDSVADQSGDESEEASTFVDPNERGAGQDPAPPVEEAGAGAATSDEGKPAKRVFPDDPLFLDQLRLVDADVNITAERLMVGKTDIRQLNAELLLKDGMLTLAPLTGLAGAGRIDGQLRLDAQQAAANLSVDLMMDQVPMPITGGRVDLNMDLKGKGATPAAIMGSLDGDLLLEIRDGRIPQTMATRVGKGLFSFSGERDYTDLECGILRMNITDGVANFDDRLAVQLTEVNWTGGGEIDFNTEEMAVAVAPKPRKGLGITVGDLASLVYVGGTLAEPSVRLNPKDVAIKYGKYLAYVSTGGLSLVAEALFNRAVADRDLCSVIAERPEQPADDSQPAAKAAEEVAESRSQ